MIEFTLYDANDSGNVKNTVYPTAVRISDTASLRKATSLDHVCAKYRDNRRSEANFEYADCIMMDCDNDHSDSPAEWKTPEAVAAAFPNCCFGVSYSRNHMKEKNGRAPRPKFHVYFPIKQVSEPKLYVAMKRQILERFPWFDHNAADAARFFLGADNGAELVEGSITIDALLPEIITEGSRNATLSQKAARLIKRYGDTDEAHALFMEEAAKCVPPLEQSELDSIWRSARSFGKRISKEPGYVPPEQYNPPAELTGFLSTVDMANNRRYPWTILRSSGS